MESLRFHNQLGSGKTCPGRSIDYDEILRGVTEVRKALAGQPLNRSIDAYRGSSLEQAFAPSHFRDEELMEETGDDAMKWSEQSFYRSDDGYVMAAPGARGITGRGLTTSERPPPEYALCGRKSTPGYHCAGKDIVEGRGLYCLSVGGIAIDQAVASAFLEAVTPAAVEAMRMALQQDQKHHDAALARCRLEVERLRYDSEKAERRYRAVEPTNRLVARDLETEWENRLRDLAGAEAELPRKERQQPGTIGPERLLRT